MVSRALRTVASILLLVVAVSPSFADDVLVPPSGTDSPVVVFVELTEPPTAHAYAKVMQSEGAKWVGTLSTDRAALIARADAAGREQHLRVSAQQRNVVSALKIKLPESASILYQVENALNGIALMAPPDLVDDLAKIKGVKSVQIMQPEYPTNSTSVPFIEVPKIWENSIGLPQGYTGTGMRIAVIDTGVDYQHSNFGGTGLLADYQANDRAVAPDTFFPTAKVPVGHDFAGDAYNGNTVPVPDNDPMDCNGHGSHVAGTAAGYGVNADGTTYAGPLTSGAAYGTLRIGPGTAPGAQIYAYRVFGCLGSTNLTVAAIDRAMDPNQDFNLSDHVDVINMSLGSNFGTLTNPSSVASDNAALAGVIVVTSAGNAGDTFYISGSPGAAARAIATAAILDSGLPGTALQVNSPGAIAGNYPAQPAGFTGPTPPAPSGQTANVVLAVDPADGAGPSVNDGCSAFTNAAAIVGNFALVERGTCGFQVKVANAQAAGAVGAIVANNVPGDPTLISMGNTAGQPAITIPSVFVATATGAAIKAQLALPATVNATLAAVSAGDQVAAFSSRGPRSSTVGLKPDIAAPGQSITSSLTGVTCTAGACQSPNGTGFNAGNLALTISGTSMASPHMAGVMALLRQIHPDWSVEELKALAMNGALHDVFLGAANGVPAFGVGRAGSGRTDPPKSAVTKTIAFNDGEAGAVSVVFLDEITAVSSNVKRVRVENKGTTDVTYDLSLRVTNDAPGISFSLPGGSSVSIPAGESVLIDVMTSSNPALMDHTREATMAPTFAVTAPAALNGLAIPRQWVTEESALLTFSISGVEKLRVPIYSSNRPASTMSGSSSIVTGGAATGSTTIPMSGIEVCTGTLAAGPTCTGTLPNDVVSLVSPFELQVVSPRDPTLAPYQDLQYAGVAASATRIWFGLTTWGDWTTPSQMSFTVYIDNNLDGTYDRQIINSNSGVISRLFGTTFSDNDSHIVAVLTPPGTVSTTIAASTPSYPNSANGSQADTAIFNNNVMFISATPAQLGLANVNTPFRYKIETCPGFAPWCQQLNGFHLDTAAGPFSWSGALRGLDFNNGSNLFFDLNGAAIPVTWNVANMTANGSPGALFLHHHNVAGRRAQIIPLDTAPQTDLAVTAGSAPSNPPLNSTVTITVNLTNTGVSAVGVTVNVPLPAGLSWVSDVPSLGVYNNATGEWTIPALPTGTQSLVIQATVESTDPQQVTAQITSGTPVDPFPANNQSTFVVSAPRSGDLEVTAVASAPTALVGTAISYTFTLKNNGVDPAYSINLADSFPGFPALAPSTATASMGTFDIPSKTWNLSGLGTGLSATLNLGLTAPNMAGTLTNSGTATSTTADPNNLDNTDSASITILSPSNVSGIKLKTGLSHIGATVTYTVTLSNSAAYDQQDNAGDEFTDVLPATLTLVSANASSGSAVATIGTNTVTWNGVVGAGGNVTITITATINGTAVPGNTITNNGTINYDANGDGTNEATNSVSANFTVNSPATLTATKTWSGQNRPGGTITYTVTINNSGPAAQLDNPSTEFTDVLPASLTLVSANATSGTAIATVGTNTVTWNGSIAAAGSVTITITATVSGAAPAYSTISNQGTLSYDADGNQTNEASAQTDDPGTGTANDATAFTVFSPATITTATKTVSGAFYPGSTVTYTVVLTNGGPSTLIDNAPPEFTDTVPAALTVTNATANSGLAAFAGNNVTWNGSLANGASVTITITATLSLSATQGTVVSNQGVAHYDANGDGTQDATLATDNPSTGTAGDSTDFTVVSPSGIVSPPKTVTGSFRAGTNVTYSITIHNGGPGAQLDNSGDEFVDVLPASLALVSANATSGTATTGSNTVHWNGSVPNGGDVTITIVATILNSNAPLSTISNQGTVNIDSNGDGSNETSLLTNDPGTPAGPDPTTFTVLSPSTIASASMTATGTFQPGSNVTYTVTIQNSGPDAQLDNPGDEFNDTLPGTLTIVSASSSSGAATSSAKGVATKSAGGGEVVMAGETVHWNGAIPAGGSVTITIVAQIQNGLPAGTTISNQGVVHYDADGNGTNESSFSTNDPSTGASNDSTSFSVASPSTIASPSKTVSAPNPNGGGSVTYTITITNSGSSAQSDNPGDEFVDVLPSQLTLTGATASSGVALPNIATNTVTWNGPIPVSGSVTITITATIEAVPEGTVISNQGTVNFDADGNGTNESQVLTNDPSTAAPNDPTSFVIAGAIPTLSELAILALAVMLAAAAMVALKR